jgi:uncharacterized integral membrane protein
MMSSLRFLFGLVVMIFLVTFAVTNNTPIKLYYYFNFQSPEIPLFLVVLASVFIGALFVWVLALFDRIRLKMSVGKKDKRIRELEKELVDLRNLPAEEPAGKPEAFPCEAEPSEEKES